MSRNEQRSTLAAAILLAALMASPSRGFALSELQSPDVTLQTAQQTYEHANGLRLVLSADYRATTTANGFLIEPASGNDRRYPLQISIALADKSPEIATDRLTRLSPGRRIRYAVTKLGGGGSGGDEYELVGVEYTKGRWIRYYQPAQSESVEPSFQVWDIAKGVSYKPR
jgi:hypothetical protein